MKKYVLLLIVASTASCAHKIENISDLKINSTYQMVGGNPDISQCTIKVQNVATVVPSQNDKVASVPMIKVLDTPAMICGKVDCSKNIPGDGVEYDCIPLELIQGN